METYINNSYGSETHFQTRKGKKRFTRQKEIHRMYLV